MTVSQIDIDPLVSVPYTPLLGAGLGTSISLQAVAFNGGMNVVQYPPINLGIGTPRIGDSIFPDFSLNPVAYGMGQPVGTVSDSPAPPAPAPQHLVHGLQSHQLRYHS